MSILGRSGQTCHDGSVRRRAAGLKANGWKVKADIEGYVTPSILNGARPDIIARKNGKVRIIEVETIDTRFRHRVQQRLLREYGKAHKDTQVNVRTCTCN